MVNDILTLAAEVADDKRVGLYDLLKKNGYLPLIEQEAHHG